MVNKIGFTLKELSFCGEPFEYRMEFKSENSEAVSYELTKTPINLGERLQVFEIDEGNEIDFELTGYYAYEIYQTTSNNLVEVGLLRVESQEVQDPTINNAQNPQVYGA